MAYGEDLADRGRAVLPPEVAGTERHMFGGLPFLLGHMFCGVVKDTLMVRLGPEDADRPWTSRTCGRWTSPAGP